MTSQQTVNAFYLTRAILGALFIVAVLTIALFAVETDMVMAEEKTTIRTVDLAVPPPPPPPPPSAQQTSQEAPTLDLTQSGAGAALMVTEFTETILLDEPIEADLPDLAEATDWDNLLAVNWQAFGLDDLDETPRLLTSLKINWPDSLTRRGIQRVALELDVLIDESGKVTLRSINGAPPAEMVVIVKRLMRTAKFTSPTKDGSPVRATFIWPLEFSRT